MGFFGTRDAGDGFRVAGRPPALAHQWRGMTEGRSVDGHPPLPSYARTLPCRHSRESGNPGFVFLRFPSPRLWDGFLRKGF